MEFVDHDLKDGYQLRCQICGSEKVHEIIDLGSQPLADKLHPIGEKLKESTSYPLIQAWCENCGLNQLKYICPSGVMFGDNYNYKTGVTKELVRYSAVFAKQLVKELNLNSNDLVCDLGSNDGTLLQGFKSCGVQIYGVEPTDIADLANKNGIPTLRAPFGIKAAEKILKKIGPASLATATNVFAHVQDLGDFLNGLSLLLKEDGYFCFENHYLTSIINDTQFDTIYHEHLRSLSLSAIKKLFSYYNFTVVNAIQTARYGGTIRVLVRKGKNHKSDNSVENLILKEKEMGLFDKKLYLSFKEKALNSKLDLLKLLIELKKTNKEVIGYSLPARAMTLINYVGIDKDLISYIVEQPGSLKLNKFVPGTRIPVLSNECLEINQPEYMLIFAWHLKDDILKHLRGRGLKGKCIIPLPKVEIIDL